MTDAQIDAIDARYSLSWMAPRGQESVREFARELLAAAADDAKNAARYRWLRCVSGPGEKTAEWLLLTGLVRQVPDTPEGFDSAVDAAMREMARKLDVQRQADAVQIVGDKLSHQ
jgi:hypothetical protein